MSLPSDVVRQKVKEAATKHRASWIQLGQYLEIVHREKHFKSWGYLTFQAYCKKELTMKDSSVSKLIKSYKFLETEEPRLAEENYFETDKEARVPDADAVHALRLAQNKKEMPKEDFEMLRRDVFEEAQDARTVKQKIKKVLEDNQSEEDPETKRIKRNQKIRRLLGTLSTLYKEAGDEKILPAYLLNQISELKEKISHQIEE